MAVAYGTIATASLVTTGGGDNLTITKPTSTAEGDMLIAIIGAEGNANDPSLSGWTEIFGVADGTSARLTCLAKKAGASEGASYTFTGGGDSASGHAYLGYIMRLTGTFSGVVNVTASDTSVETATTNHTFETGIIVATTSDVQIQGMLAYGGLPAQSAYAVTNNNPTWTERADFTEDGTGTQDAGLSAATGTAATAGATGNWSLTLDTSLAGIGYIINVAETSNGSTTLDLATLTATPQSHVAGTDVTGTAVVTLDLASLTATPQAPTLSGGTAKWITEDKTDTSPTITNEAKS